MIILLKTMIGREDEDTGGEDCSKEGENLSQVQKQINLKILIQPESGAETDQSKNLIISHRLIHMVAKCQSEHLKGWSEGTFLSVGMRISAKN